MNKAIILLTALIANAGSIIAHADYEFEQVPLSQQLEIGSSRDLEAIESPKSEPKSTEYVILIQKGDNWCNTDKQQDLLSEIARKKVTEKIKYTYDKCVDYWK